MADKPVTEVVAVDAALDALSSPTSSDVYDAVDGFNEKAVAAAAAARALAGGGSQPWKIERVPIAFDTPGLVVAPLVITGINQGTQTVTITGSHAALFPVGAKCRIALSTGNDEAYTVASSAAGGGNTTVVVVEALPDATVDGNLINSGTAGIVVYTPTAGEYWTRFTDSVTTVWDAASGSATGWLYSEGDDYYSAAIGNVAMDNADETPGQQSTHLRTPTDLNLEPIQSFFLDSAPVRFVIDDGAPGGDPGSSQGVGELILFIAANS